MRLRLATLPCAQIVGRTLRYIAHTHGAFLMYLGGLHSMGAGAPGGGKDSDPAAKDATMDKSLLDNFTRLMNHLVFTGLEKKP